MHYFTIKCRAIDKDGAEFEETTYNNYSTYDEARKNYERLKTEVIELHWTMRDEINAIPFETTEWELDSIYTNENDEITNIDCIDTKRTTKIYKDKTKYVAEANPEKEEIKDYEESYNYWINKIKNMTSCDYIQFEH